MSYILLWSYEKKSEMTFFTIFAKCDFYIKPLVVSWKRSVI